MAKTAEEFVMERYSLTKYDMKNEDLLRVSGVDIAQDIDDYAGDFAAQEVEAYKKKILDEIDTLRKAAVRAYESEYQLGYLKATTNMKAVINELIDAVK